MNDELSTIRKSLYSKASFIAKLVAKSLVPILKKVSTISDAILATLYMKEKTILRNKLSLYFRKYLYLKMLCSTLFKFSKRHTKRKRGIQNDNKKDSHKNDQK